MSIKELKEDIKRLEIINVNGGINFNYKPFSNMFQKYYTRDEFAELFYEMTFDKFALDKFERKKVDEYFKDADFGRLIRFMDNFNWFGIKFIGGIERGIFQLALEQNRDDEFDIEEYNEVHFFEDYDPQLPHNLLNALLEHMMDLVEKYETTIEVFREMDFNPKELGQIIAEYAL